MHNKFFIVIKSIVIVLIVSFFCIAATLDFVRFNNMDNKKNIYSLQSQYDEDKEIGVEIFGNYYLSDEIILKILNNEEYESDYNFLLNEMKIVTVSDKEKIILIKENSPIFYDKKSLYLSSKKRIKSDINILNKKNLIFLATDLKEIPDPFIRKMESFTDQIKNDYELFYNDLDSITYSTSEMSFNIFVNGCKIKLAENVFQDKLDINSLNDKIHILDAFIEQENKDINQIKEIDLRWDKEAIVIWKE